MRGIVVCVDSRAADRGAEVLEAGGNAFDAAIAAAFVQMVVSPLSCGVGGMASALLWKPATSQRFVVDGLLRAGSRVTEDMWEADYADGSEPGSAGLFEDLRGEVGYGSICTPGAVAALGEVHRHLGSLPWRDLLQPAVRLARDGFAFHPVTPSGIVEDPGPRRPDDVARVRATPECARLYYRDSGTAPADGETFRNPDYARTLERLAEAGAADLYAGELAETVAADLERNGSFVTRDDLREYRTGAYAPHLSVYGDTHLYSNLPPGGGLMLALAMNVLAGLSLGKIEHSGAEHIAYLASTLRLVHREGRDLIGDPDHLGHMPMRRITSAERAAALRTAVVEGAAGATAPLREPPGAVHVTAVDGEGNVASVTHGNGRHSGVVTPGLGFVYNNGMDRFDPRPGRPSSMSPRRAAVHMMMPGMATTSGRPSMAFGATGGDAVLGALVQTVSNLVDFGMSAVEAVSAPRIHTEGSTVRCEAGVRSDVVAELEERGFTVVRSPESHADGVGLAHLVLAGPEGGTAGGSDPRGAGGVAHAR